jgi:hypothetical protein
LKVEMAANGKWCCDRYRWGRLRELEVKLEIFLEQTVDLKRKNKGLKDQLRAAVGEIRRGEKAEVRSA